MKATKIAKLASALALAATLVACGGASSSLSMEALPEVSGVKVTAENAGTDNVASSEGAITVNEGDVIVISPSMDKGSIHVTITSSDGKTTVYDDDAEGKVLYSVNAAPGTYNVTTSGNKGSTGWATIFAQSTEEMAKQDAELAETLEKEGIDPSVLETDE